MTNEELEAEWRKTVYDRPKIIDPSEERHWGDMAYGWLLAKGVEPEAAAILAVKWRYDLGIA